jgi:uncharacterized protein YlxP (DUF503 family)
VRPPARFNADGTGGTGFAGGSFSFRAENPVPARISARKEACISASPMPVGLLTLELHIPDAQSLKDKRQVLRSLKDKLRRDFNVAVAELDHHDVWQRSVIGIVTLSNEEKHLREMLNKVLDEADRILGSSLISQNFEII